MEVTEITISAGRTFNHPFESYSNLRADVMLRAMMTNTDDPDECVKVLQAKAERMVEDHKQGMIQSLHELREAQRLNEEIGDLEERLRETQEGLNRLRKVKRDAFPAALPEPNGLEF